VAEYAFVEKGWLTGQRWGWVLLLGLALAYVLADLAEKRMSQAPQALPSSSTAPSRG
jgi:hypothetical protein